MSGKKARKLQKAANHKRQREVERAMREGGEVEMRGMYSIDQGEEGVDE